MPDIIERVRNVFTDHLVPPNELTHSSIRGERVDPSVLLAYYENNGLYRATTPLQRTRTPVEAMKPIRNPANAAVEFYAALLWPGEIPVVSENDRIIGPISDVRRWSNWPAKKQVAVRWAAIYGEMCLKVAQMSDGRPFHQVIDGRHVTSRDVDDRGFLVQIRIDVPQERADPETGNVSRFTRTEIWTRDRYRMWKNERGSSANVDQLGQPIEDIPLAQMGIDFVPFVVAKFRDNGGLKGWGCFEHALDAIDEANRQAVRLHQMLFRHNDNVWALRANDTDPTGRPLPPPMLRSGDSDGSVAIGGGRIVQLPGRSQLESLVPQIDYDSALKILIDQVDYIKLNHLPELLWYDIARRSDASGRAIQMMLSSAIARCLEARSNLEAALVRADDMALTLGSASGVWSEIGSYEAGDFWHSFAERPVIDPLGLEQAQEAKAWVEAGVPTSIAARWSGVPEGDLVGLEEARTLEDIRRRENLGQALAEQMRTFDVGEGGDG